MRLRWFPQAADDLEDIYAYLLEHHPNLASPTVDGIYKAIGSLRQMPNRGRPRALPGLRDLVLVDLPYIVTYRVRPDAVEILYIRHSSRGPMPDRAK